MANDEPYLKIPAEAQILIRLSERGRGALASYRIRFLMLGLANVFVVLWGIACVWGVASWWEREQHGCLPPPPPSANASLRMEGTMTISPRGATAPSPPR